MVHDAPIEEYKLVEMRRFYAVAEACAKYHRDDDAGIEGTMPRGMALMQYYFHPAQNRVLVLPVEGIATGQRKGKRGGWVDFYERKGFIRKEGDELMACVKDRQAEVYHSYKMFAPWEAQVSPAPWEPRQQQQLKGVSDVKAKRK